ncbi:MAG: hypothetical protein V4604_16200 [Bacteroidota bacterium]
MNLIRISALLVLLCQSAEVGERQRSPDADLNSAKRNFAPYPMLKFAIDVPPSPVLQPATKAVPYDDPDSFFKALAHKTFNDTRVIELHPGDLNADGLQDMLILTSRDPGESEKPTSRAEPIQYRRVVLFLQVENGDYRFATYNNTIVGSSVSDTTVPKRRADPYHRIQVLNGKIIFECIYGSHKRTIVTKTYVYRPAYRYWYLENVLNETYSCNMRDNPPGTIAVQSTLTTVKGFRKTRF